MHDSINRRSALRWLGAAGASATVLPARLAFAAPPVAVDPLGNRLVVVMLRGALDGLAAVPAVGDALWSALRGDADAAARAAASAPPVLPLDATFAMHPSLAHLHRWYGQKELLVVHATATPYRERSHFDAQQLLESGGDKPFVLNTGWLGRAMPSGSPSAIAITAAMPLALRGTESASTWTPDRRKGNDQDLLARVAQMYRDDPQLSAALSQAMGQQDMAMGAEGGAGLAALAKQAGVFLSDPKGPRIAWLEANGWDTHTNQAGRLTRALSGLDDGLAALRDGLGAHWARTTVLVMTEFGRSAAYNGTAGTDHGTGGVAFVAGGNVAGGKVLTDWPGLGKAQLLDGRDLKPTTDLRSIIAPIVQRQTGVGTAKLRSDIFPGLAAKEVQLWRS
jgi:uncharacterized protein (DUF1501 family)